MTRHHDRSSSCYDQACKNLDIHHSHKKESNTSNELDYYGKVLQTSTVPVRSGSEEEVKYGKIANPTVHIALNQLRKVVNEIIKDYGKPDQINLEIARDLKNSKKERN